MTTHQQKTSLAQIKVVLSISSLLLCGLICLCQVLLTGTNPFTFAYEEIQSYYALEKLTNELERLPLPSDTNILAAHTAYSCPPTGNHPDRYLWTSQLLQSQQTKAELEAFYEPYSVRLLFVHDIDRHDYYGIDGPLLRKYQFPDSVPALKTWVLIIKLGLYHTESGYNICH